MASRHAGTHDAFMARMVDIRVKDLLKDITIDNLEVTSIPIVRWINKLKHEKDGRTLRHVTELVYNHATRRDSNPWVDAKLCLKIYEDISPEFRDGEVVDGNGTPVTGGHLFIRFLVDLCVGGFERIWPHSGGTADESGNGDTIDQRRQVEKFGGVELMELMGQLFLLDMITEEIVHDCVQDLLTRTDNCPGEMTLESLCELFEIVGEVLEAKAPDVVDVYFQCLEDRTNSAIDTKLRERIQTLIELRQHGWLRPIDYGWQNRASGRGSKWRDAVDSHSPSVSFSKLNPACSNEAPQGTFAGNRANAPFVTRRPSEATSWEPPTPTSPLQVTLPSNEPNWRFSQKPRHELSSEAPTYRRKLKLLPRSQQMSTTPSRHPVSDSQSPSPVSPVPHRDTTSIVQASTLSWRNRQRSDEDQVSWRSYPHPAKLGNSQRIKKPRLTRHGAIDRVNENLHEFFVSSEDLDDAVSRFNRLAVEDQYIFIHRVVSFAIKSDSADVKFVSEFLGRLRGGLFSFSMLEEAFTPTAESLNDIVQKFPNARMNFAKLFEAAGLDKDEEIVARFVRFSAGETT